MNLKALLDSRFPWVAATYRMLRDQRLAARWPFSKVPLGFEMIGPPGTAESRIDSGELSLFLELLKGVDVFIDVGANCGFFSLVARNASIKTLAIEPNEENLRALLFNLKRNSFADVEVHPIALAADINVLPLFSGGQGASLTKGWGGIVNTYSRLVPVNTIDNLFGSRFIGKRLLIKLDVEGNEFDVLQASREVLQRTPAPTWIVEHGFKENFSEGVNPRFRDLFELFWQNGYHCFTADFAKKQVTESDVDRWLTSGQRDFGFLNYLFTR